jgi:hypothetical protein
MKVEIKPPPFGFPQIINRAEKLIEDYRSIVGTSTMLHQGLHFEDVFEQVIYPNYEIELDESKDLGFDENGKKILGCFDPKGNRAFIDNSLEDDPRRVFTQWHEVGGHGVLQGEWLRNQLNRQRTIVTTEESLSPNTISILERQANLFASHAAAPSWFVDAVIVKIFRPTKPFLFFGPCRYWLDVNGMICCHHVDGFDELCRLIAWKIQRFFGGLSKEALGYRIKESPRVVDRTIPTTLLFRLSPSYPPPPGHSRPTMTLPAFANSV